MLQKKQAPMRQMKTEPGFALVVTVSMLTLVALLALAMLSLSGTASRSQGQSRAMAEAQSNARLALMMAIGELQRQMGPDQRVSANGSLRDTSIGGAVVHPHWVGAWDAWVTDPDAARVNPDYPSAASHHQTLGNQPIASMRPEYDQKDRHFRRWLLSLDPDEAMDVNAPVSLRMTSKPLPDAEDDSIHLVHEGSLGPSADNTDFVSARLIGVNEGGELVGRYAWWIGDESQKARVMGDNYSRESLTSAEKLYRSQAAGTMGNKAIAEFVGINVSDFDKAVSHQSMGLLADAAKDVPKDYFHSATVFSQGILADVREGGLKRDLNTILEQPILRDNDGDAYMLYAFDDPRFTDRSSSRVPIQDLAAYYQLYDDQPEFANERREGVRYSSSAIPRGIQLKVPDYDGGDFDRQNFLREYTTLYKQPVVAKVQFLVCMTAHPITAADRQEILDRMQNPPGNAVQRARVQANLVPIRDTDTHKLKLGLMPMVTLWNPNNVSLVMEDDQILYVGSLPIGMKARKYRSQGDVYQSPWWSGLNAYAEGKGNEFGSIGGNAWASVLKLHIAKGGEQVVFEPGEVKVFSLPEDAAADLLDVSGNQALRLAGDGLQFIWEGMEGWDPYAINVLPSSTPVGPSQNQAPDAYIFTNRGYIEHVLVFGPEDRITFRIESDSRIARSQWNTTWDGRIGNSGVGTTAFSVGMADYDFIKNWRNRGDLLRHYHTGGGLLGGSPNQTDKEPFREVGEFNRRLMTQGFPGREDNFIDFEDKVNAVKGSTIINAVENRDEAIALWEYTLSQGCEIANRFTGGFGGGRSITSRPFLHSSPSAPKIVTESDLTDLYNHGWNWKINKVNSVEDSVVTAKFDSDNGYFGGGYTSEEGSTHVVQRDIPVVPPISIASMSHAELGGFSLAYGLLVGHNPDATNLVWTKSRYKNGKPSPNNDLQRVTATGQGGLGPHISQAIGNSYAHPNIAADRAFVFEEKLTDVDDGPVANIPFVDHSYLANKALWDEYFFSSITPQPAKVPYYGSSEDLSALEVAEKFFEGTKPLPNRRFIPYLNSSNSSITEMFSEDDLYEDGLADKIASHLMMKGPFNINSTSVEAWKIFLSSQLGNPALYVEEGVLLSEDSLGDEELLVGYGMFANQPPVASADIEDSNIPNSQWTGARKLTSSEIDGLAEAMVEQVKQRGPFLSLSEFINRRLEGDSDVNGSAKRSVMGALQAAIDSDDVSINQAFRTSGRMIDAETKNLNFAFPQAATGPIAYGSTAYVDQADVLRSFAGQLTPRGDTFVIRTYGDSFDARGRVQARAWCEAVVQRVPDYVDASDEAHKKQSDLSETNKIFGRQFKVISFRWLNRSEV